MKIPEKLRLVVDASIKLFKSGEVSYLLLPSEPRAVVDAYVKAELPCMFGDK